MATGSNVLVATDLSEASGGAIREVLDRARAAHARCELCHVVPPPFRRARQLLRGVADLATWGAERTTVLAGDGHAHELLVRRSVEDRIDLLVVYGAGLTDARALFRPSFAEQLIRHAPCPVLIARDWPCTGLVLVATDLGQAAPPAIAAAAAEARRRRARIIAVHCLDTTPLLAEPIGAAAGAGSHWPVPRALANARRDAEARLARAVGGLGVPGEPRVVEGPVVGTIAALAAEVRAELVVVGSRGRSRLARLIRGNIAVQVARAVPCSVLVVPVPARATGATQRIE
jgi:nucleotide-binding universal stress UspA family protein